MRHWWWWITLMRNICRLTKGRQLKIPAAHLNGAFSENGRTLLATNKANPAAAAAAALSDDNYRDDISLFSLSLSLGLFLLIPCRCFCEFYIVTRREKKILSPIMC